MMGKYRVSILYFLTFMRFRYVRHFPASKSGAASCIHYGVAIFVFIQILGFVFFFFFFFLFNQ